tara:strand:+ start:442 stop:1356 length:915 start_codon:yes stop_codon:yes gene_type:complete
MSPSKKNKSETVRDEMAANVRQEKGDKKGSYDPRNKLNDLTSTEWIPETISVWTQKGLGASHPDAKLEKEHPAPFSFTDVSRLIKFFTKENQVVLDPFVGIGSTLKACAIERRNGIGIELNKKYVRLSKQRLKNETYKDSLGKAQKILLGDARDVLDEIEDDTVDFVVTSPPYWNILQKKDHKVKQERESKSLDQKYSDDPRDLGNIDQYEDFLVELTDIFRKCKRVLKPDKYMAVVVSDFRDKSKYVMFHSDLAIRLESLGLEMKGIKVLYQRHKRVFPYGYPYSYVPNIHNQFILILQNEKK